MPAPDPQFQVQWAQNAQDIQGVQRLRYDVFVTELGATCAGADHTARLEVDRFDQNADHLVLRDVARPQTDQIVGVYRLMNAAQAGPDGFASDLEYDLSALKTSGKAILELSRSCLHPDYRGGSAMFHLWQALARHIAEAKVDILFGVASFHGKDPRKHAAALQMLFADHPSPYPVTSRAPAALPETGFDRKEALRQTPALIKAYLRLGGAVGQGAYVDEGFNTTDVCMILDTAAMNDRQKAIYAR